LELLYKNISKSTHNPALQKMKLLLSLALITLLVSSCTKNEVPNYVEPLQGTWINSLVNQQTVMTDETFVMEFKPGNIEMYAAGFQHDENNKSWHESTNYLYEIVGDRIIIIGIDVLGNATHIEFKIESLTNGTLTLTVPFFSVNGIVTPNNNTFTCIKVTEDYREEFTGIWYGRSTTAGYADSLFHYWEYFEDGTFNYYYQDDNEVWVKKSDNEGHYFLYGNLMASNYSHDLISGGSGLAFECWNFIINGNKMTWTGLRENHITITYEMERVSLPPATTNQE
jgi:hypothetical protein